MNKLLVLFAFISFSVPLSLSGICSNHHDQSYAAMDDEKFYQFFHHHAENNRVVSDTELKAQPRIQNYAFDCNTNHDDALLNEYAKRRIQAKKSDGIYPRMTDQDVVFLQSEPTFLQNFNEFLKMHNSAGYYSRLAAKAYELFRGPPTEEYNLGKPSLDSRIRKENNDFVQNLNIKRDGMYENLDAYMKCISETHDHGMDYLSYKAYLMQNEAFIQI